MVMDVGVPLYIYKSVKISKKRIRENGTVAPVHTVNLHKNILVTVTLLRWRYVLRSVKPGNRTHGGRGENRRVKALKYKLLMLDMTCRPMGAQLLVLAIIRPVHLQARKTLMIRL